MGPPRELVRVATDAKPTCKPHGKKRTRPLSGTASRSGWPPSQGLAEGHAWATDRVQALQRASSAVEGRNGFLAQMHPNHRGLPQQRSKMWTVLHNCECRTADGTPPASRFFRQACPDLFATVLAHVEDLPRPRQRSQIRALRG